MKKFFEKHDLVKLVCIAIVFTLVLTWIIPSGIFQEGAVTGTIQRTGLSDLFMGGMMSVSFFLQQIMFLLFVGAFYGIMTKIDGYKKLVEVLAKKLKGKEIVSIVVISFIIAGLTSVVTNIFVVFAFVPFIISVLRKMGLDSITAFATTFGSILIGILGATYGTEGLISFVNYMKYYATATISIELAVRAGILVLAFVLFNFFNVNHAKKVLTDKKAKKEENDDIFAVEESTKKKIKTWPIVAGFIVIFAFIVLGFIDWKTNFQIEIFEEFHIWLNALKIGDFAVMTGILGANAASFGTWQLYHIILIMSVVLVMSIIIYRTKLNELIENIGEGVKKMMKPIGIIFLIYIIFVFMYWSPIVPTMVNWFTGMVDGFNPFLTSIGAIVSSLFHIDYGYTGYALGGLLATYDGDAFNIAFLIYSTINGLVCMIAPTSIVLMAGLAYCNISYKKWFSYIWKFLVGMLVCLLVIFTLLTYL